MKAFPDPADQIRLVENGEGTMPSFKGELSTAEIEDVVDVHADRAQVAAVTSASSAFLSTLCIPERGSGVSRTTRRRGSL